MVSHLVGQAVGRAVAEAGVEGRVIGEVRILCGLLEQGPAGVSPLNCVIRAGVRSVNLSHNRPPVADGYPGIAKM
eukprot:SAG25_NODE_4375_length_828_cov_1.547325_1_plen_75_part_00